MAESHSKRSACDRCRGQKLRCERESANRPCNRCRKAKASCYTQREKTPKSPGTALSNDNDSIYWDGPYWGETPLVEQTGYIDVAHTSDLLDSEFGDSAIDFSMDCTVNEFLDTTHQDQLNQFGANGEMLQDAQTTTRNIQQPLSANRSTSGLSTETMSENCDPILGYGLSQQVSNGYPRVCQGQSYHHCSRFASASGTRCFAQQERPPITQLLPSDRIKAYTTQILDLNSKFTKRAEEYMSTRQSASTTVNGIAPVASRRFLEMLFNDSHILLTILRRIRACITRPSPEESSTENSPSPSSHSNTNGLDFHASLAITAAYAHTIQAFESVFQDILRKARNANCENVCAVVAECMPQVSVGSIQFPFDPQTHAKYLLNFSSTILEVTEAILGVTSPPQVADGLLCNAHSQSLLDALLSQNDLAYEKTDGTRAARVKLTIDNILELIDSPQS